MKKTHSAIPGVEWIPGTGEFIKIDLDKCTGCANCLRVCLGNCFEFVDKKARIRTLDTCMECGACWYVCDALAIEFSWPKGGTGFKTKYG